MGKLGQFMKGNTGALLRDESSVKEPGQLIKNAKSQFCNIGQLTVPNFNGTNYTLIMRPMTLRDVHMPFFLCFTKTDQEQRAVLESINSAEDSDGNPTAKENQFIALNGRSKLGIGNYRYFPTNQQLV